MIFDMCASKHAAAAVNSMTPTVESISIIAASRILVGKNVDLDDSETRIKKNQTEFKLNSSEMKFSV